MPAKKPEARTTTVTQARPAKARPAKRPKKRARPTAVAKEAVLDRVLSQVEAPAVEAAAKPKSAAQKPALATRPGPTAAQSPTPGPLQVARVVAVEGRVAEVVFRGETGRTTVALGDEVESEVIAAAMKNRDPVLVERPASTSATDPPPVVLGVLSARRPRELHLRADTITLEAAREVLLRSGTGALRIREDGDVELVGSRILAMSRGLFRIVGRMLRLN